MFTQKLIHQVGIVSSNNFGERALAPNWPKLINGMSDLFIYLYKGIFDSGFIGRVILKK